MMHQTSAFKKRDPKAHEMETIVTGVNLVQSDELRKPDASRRSLRMIRRRRNA